jgi:hypothetical protein
MALPANIQQFKSSGVYRLEFDKSQLINIPAETIRLVIGYSNKGPFNTPVFCPDNVFFTDVFGSIDTGLELKGSYFHRSCLTALDRGPILALNLMKLDDSVKGEFRALSAQSNAHNHIEYDSPVSEFFNQDKFWFIDDDAVISAINQNDPNNVADISPEGSTIFNFANAGKKNISIFVIKSDLPGFDVSAEEWYGTGLVPPFLDKSSWISDFLIRVVVLEGDFSNYNALSIDPIYGDYFDSKGLKSTYIDAFGNTSNGLDKLLQLPEVSSLAEYHGSFIPEFQDKDGTNLFIEDIINNNTSATGLVCAMNDDWFYDNPSSITNAIVDGLQIDLIGHGLEANKYAISKLDFLSYYGALNALSPYTQLDFSYGASADGLSPWVFRGKSGATVQEYKVLQALYTGMGATGAYDEIGIYGPYHTDVTTNAASSYWTTDAAGQASFEAFCSTVFANRSFISGGVTGASASAPLANQYNLIKVKAVETVKETGPLDDLLQIQIYDSSQDGIVPGIVPGTTSGAGTYFTLGYEAGLTGNGAGVTANAWIEVQPSINYCKNPGPTYATMYGGPLSKLGTDAIGGIITSGDKIQDGTLLLDAYAQVSVVNEQDLSTAGLGADVDLSLIGASVSGAITNIYLSHEVSNAKVTAYTDAEFTAETGILPTSAGYTSQWVAIPTSGATGATYDSSVVIGTLTGDINEVFPVPSFGLLAPNKVILGATGTTAGEAYVGEVIVGQFLVRGFEGVTGSGDYNSSTDPRTGTSRLTRVKRASYDGATGSSTYGYFIIECDDAIYTWPDVSGDPTAIERYTSINDFVSHYTATALDGYSIPGSAKPNNTNTRMNEILDVMYNTNIAATLEDRDAITFRYIVDTFNHGIEPSSKARLSKICKGRKNAFAILNSPSVKEFKKSTNPLFKYDSTSTFDARYVATGGNLSLNPTNIYSLPGIADGANYCGFYTPNLRISENGATKFVPPAASISNLYIDKYNLALPWSIVAGPRRGVVSGVGVSGVEYPFDRKDLDEIEPFGLNAIINKRGFGLVINANQTAQQTVKSALSQIHVRELLIYLEDGIAEILKNYRWEFNTAANRLEIKTLCDNFCSQILNDGGLYDFQNVMDSSNNTAEVIDNNIGIIDTYVEPVRGMGILVNRVTILKTGSIAAGNF